MRPEEKQFIKFIQCTYSKPITLIDVGANLGEYSKFFNNQISCKKIHLFEPIKDVFDNLPEDEIHTKYNIGLGSENKTLKFHRCVGREAHSSFILREFYIKKQYELEYVDIDVRRLDNIINNEHIEVLKIDTEGFELEVLKGASKLLESNCIDYIQFEYGGCFLDQGIKLNDIIEYLKQFNYAVFDLNINKFNRITHFVDNYMYYNFYAIKNNGHAN